MYILFLVYVIIIIGFLILTLHAVRPYKFDISMMAQTFSLDKSPILLVLEKKNLFGIQLVTYQNFERIWVVSCHLNVEYLFFEIA